MTKSIILAGAALIALGGAALAQPPGRPGPNRPAPGADVSRAQVIASVDQRFARMDANNDGRFTREEAQAGRQARRAERMTAMFDRLDADHNGAISREEMTEGHQRRMADGGGRGGRGGHGRRGPGGPGMRHGPPPGGPGAGEGPGGPGGPGMRGQRLFGERGFITRDQLRERALARFDRADADRNGTLTAAEREAARGQRGERMRERRQRPI
jgi:hypothetical protein